jgi:putative ABC transport system ATP-binding protein
VEGAGTVAAATQLVKRFVEGASSRTVLDGASLEVARGELLAVIGASGSGKSTLLGILGGLDRTWEGKATVLGHDLSSMSDGALSRLRGEHIGFVFQAFHLLPHLTVLDNVLAPALFASDGADRRARARELVDRLGLGGREGDAIAHLSGGQRQRVAIARALLRAPSLLLCDEPTGNLDAETGERIADLFRSIAHDERVAVIAATHSEVLASRADRTLRLEGGQLR